MEKRNDIVLTLRPDGRPGVPLLKINYNLISSFILHTLSTNDREIFTLHNLLEETQKKFVDSIDCDIAWHVFQIKLDLEARDLIKITSSPGYGNRLMFIKLTRKGVKEFHFNKV